MMVPVTLALVLKTVCLVLLPLSVKLVCGVGLSTKTDPLVWLVNQVVLGVLLNVPDLASFASKKEKCHQIVDVTPLPVKLGIWLT